MIRGMNRAPKNLAATMAAIIAVLLSGLVEAAASGETSDGGSRERGDMRKKTMATQVLPDGNVVGEDESKASAVSMRAAISRNHFGEASISVSDTGLNAPKRMTRTNFGEKLISPVATALPSQKRMTRTKFGEESISDSATASDAMASKEAVPADVKANRTRAVRKLYAARRAFPRVLPSTATAAAAPSALASESFFGGGNGETFKPTQNFVNMVEKEMNRQKNDRSSKGFRDDLFKYAEKAVNRKLDKIKANLEKNGMLGTAVDLMWPPTAFMSIADGGNYDVLKILESKGVLKVNNVQGSSGGAASCMMALAGGSSADFLNLGYMVYAKLFKDNMYSMDYSSGQPMVWDAIYQYGMKDPEAFKRIKQHAYIGASCDSRKNTLMHNFSGIQQAGAAGAASGVPGVYFQVDPIVGRCTDACRPTWFRNTDAAQLYFDTMYWEHMTVMMGWSYQEELNHIETLYKKAVNETVAMLTSSKMSTSRMCMVKGDKQMTYSKFKRGCGSVSLTWTSSTGEFVDLSAGSTTGGSTGDGGGGGSDAGYTYTGGSYSWGSSYSWFSYSYSYSWWRA